MSGDSTRDDRGEPRHGFGAAPRGTGVERQGAGAALPRATVPTSGRASPFDWNETALVGSPQQPRLRRRPLRRRRRGSPRPEPVGKLLDALLEHRHLKAPLRIHQIRAAWRGLVGPLNASRSCPEALDRGRLTVAVADAAWHQELTFLKTDIKEKVQVMLGQGVVSEVRFRVRPGAHTPEPALCGRRPADLPDPEEELHRRPLAPGVADALSRFEEHLERVENPDLRRAIRRAYVRHLLQGKRVADSSP